MPTIRDTFDDDLLSLSVFKNRKTGHPETRLTWVPRTPSTLVNARCNFDSKLAEILLAAARAQFGWRSETFVIEEA